MGGKRGVGRASGRRARRADPARTRASGTDPRLTASAGLLGFGSYLRSEGVDRWMSKTFERLKTGPNLVYPMGFQLRLMVDLLASGETRPFGLEAKAGDALFSHICEHQVPSVDTLYDDLARFDEQALADLEEGVATQGMEGLNDVRSRLVHLDIDSTVNPLAGEHEGGLLGPNPKFHGRLSFHPLLGRIAETNMLVGACFAQAIPASAKATRRPWRRGPNASRSDSARARWSACESTQLPTARP